MTQQERNGLNEAAEISVHAAGAVRGAIKTGKAVSGAAKGAAAAGPYGAAAAALWTHRKAVVAIIAGLLAIPVLFIMLLPSLIFGGLTQTGSEGNPDSPILNDNTAIVENINQISQAISDLLEEGLEDVRTRIDADFGASSADQKEIVNPYESSPAYNANRFIAMYCAAKDQDYASISLKDMEALIRKAKDALYTFTSTEESRTTTVTETNTDPKTGKVTVTETEVTEIWKIYIAVCGTGGAGKTFLILLMALRMRRMVIMAPEMVRVISPDPSVCKTCKVYLLTMQFIPELIGQRPLVHVNRDSIGLAAAILHDGGVGHGIGEVHRYAVTGRQRLDAVCGDNRGQLRHICAAGHGDGNGIGAVVHRTGHAVDGEAGDALGSRGGRLPLAGDVDVTGRHLEAVIRDNLVHRSPTLSKAIAQGALHHLITAVGRYGFTVPV